MSAGIHSWALHRIADDWVARLEIFADNRDDLERGRLDVRRWEEGGDWEIVVEECKAMCREWG